MTLFELASRLFLFLVTFRRKIRKGIYVDLSEVRSQLDAIFSEQEAMARSDPSLVALYEKAKYPLTVLADEVVLTCGWEHASAWESQTLEERHFGTRIGGDEFFVLIDQLKEDEAEVAQIFYACLCLGFRGRYREDALELRTLRTRLYRQTPDYVASLEENLCPDAYHVEEGSAGTLRPVLNLARVGIICGVLIIVFIVASRLGWKDVTEEISEAAKALRDWLTAA